MFIAVSVLAKTVLVPGKWFAMYFLERATQVERPQQLIVFTLTGGLFSVVGALISVTLKIIDVVSTAT